MKKTGLLLVAILVLLLPWTLFFLQKPVNYIDWSCQSSHEIARVSVDTVFRSFGQVTSYYHADGTGIARFAGTFSQELPGQPTQNTTLHRATEFSYSVLGAFVKVVTNKATTLMDDNTPDALAIKYAYMGFKPGYTEYFQIMNVGSSAVAAGFAGMPRIYCQPIEKNRHN